MILDIIYILLGFFLLIKGGDYLVDGATAVATHARLSKMVIGLTVIGFGTSAPELLVSTQAALMGSSGIAIGNVVGSNIANIALILGMTALVFPLAVTREALRRDTPFMVLAVLLLSAVGLYGYIGRIVGILFFMLLVVYVAYQIRTSRKQVEPADMSEVMPLCKALLIVIASFAALVFGARLLVIGGVDIAELLGVEERIIGLTIVAVGTSLPELFATLMAARRKEADLALGNIIGSVSFNVLCVIGIASAICPIPDANSGFAFDYLVMSLLGILLWLFLYTNHKLERWEGTILLLIYIAYIIKTIIWT